MLPNQAKCRAYGTSAQTVVLRQFDPGLKPELRLTARSLYMNMGPIFFPREEVAGR